MSKLITISESELLALVVTAFREGFNSDSMPEYEGAFTAQALRILQDRGIVMPAVVREVVFAMRPSDLIEDNHADSRDPTVH